MQHYISSAHIDVAHSLYRMIFHNTGISWSGHSVKIIFVVPRLKCRALFTLGKCFTTELYSQALFKFWDRVFLANLPRLASNLWSPTFSSPVTENTGVGYHAQPIKIVLNFSLILTTLSECPYVYHFVYLCKDFYAGDKEK